MSRDSTTDAFCRDALAYLQRRCVTFRGCPAVNVAWRPDGTVEAWFQGLRDGKPWKGKVTQLALLPPDANTQEITAAADPEFVAAEFETTLNIFRHPQGVGLVA